MPIYLRVFLKKTEFWRNNKLLIGEIKNFPGIIFSILSFSLLAGLFEAFGISFLLAFLQKLIEPNAEPFSTGLEWFDILVLGINTSQTSQLLRVSALILVATILRVVFSYAGVIYAERGGIKLVNNLYKRIFEQLQSLSLDFFGRTKSGEIINTLTTEINQTKQAVATISNLFIKLIIVIAYIAMAMRISWQLTLISVMLFGLASASITNLNKYIRQASFPLTTARGKLSSIAVEFINGIRTVQAFATQDFERKRFYKASDQVANASIHAAMRHASVRPLAEMLASIILISIIVLGMTVYVPRGSLQVSALLTFIFILIRMAPAVQEISGRLAELSNWQGAIQNIETFLRTDNKPYLKNGQRSFSDLQKAIELVAVDFGYTPDDLVLQDITLTIPKGKTVALVGASGAGKSTLADLVIRFYDPTRGQLLLDGVDIREFDLTSVRQKMALVSQETFIFNTTVRSNIAYGLDSISNTDILEAAHFANALEFIKALPEGLETVLGDRGVRLSGGQRQRIAIARALLRNPEILILDEATSALDSISERLIQNSLEKLSVGRTVITIAHRLSTIRQADKVVVMERGKIVEQGTYSELLELQGNLWAYHQMQQGSNR